MRDRLDSDARIVRDDHFESGILKIQEGWETLLNVLEKQKVVELLRPLKELEKSGGSVSTIIERAAKRLRSNESAMQSTHEETRFLLPTSDMYAQYFPIAWHAMTNRWNGLLSVSFESLLFLQMNLDY